MSLLLMEVRLSMARLHSKVSILCSTRVIVRLLSPRFSEMMNLILLRLGDPPLARLPERLMAGKSLARWMRECCNARQKEQKGFYKKEEVEVCSMQNAEDIAIDI